MSDNPRFSEPALALRLEQARRWRAGDRAPAEEYLARHPELSANPEYALEVVYGELLLREEDGEAPRVEEFLGRFPQFTAQLWRLFDVHAALRSACQAESGAAARETLVRVDEAHGFPVQAAAVPGYEVLGELGRGGMGVVYKARDVRLKRLVALKVVLTGERAPREQLSRFRVEAEAVARLQHPNIIQIYEVGEQAGRHYLALEFVDGGTLAQKLNGTPLPPREAAGIVRTLAQAMHYAHTRGVLHRDLKPANVLLSGDGTAKVTDFGLAKLLAEDGGPSQTGALLGTPSYMAPEQADGRLHGLSPETDVYALGAVLYEALTGRPPFQAPSVMGTLEQVRFQEPVPPSRLQPRLPRNLEVICLKCLEKEPKKRYASAGALAEDLRRFLGGEPILARPPTLAARFWLWCHRPERVRDAGSFMVFLGVVCLVWCLGGIALFAGGVPNLRDRAAAIVSLVTFILVFHLPLIGIGLGTMARRRLFLRAGVLVSAVDLAIALSGMVGSNPISDLLDVGGVYDDPRARYALFSLLGVLMGVQFFGYCIAVVAYQSNRDSLR